MEIFIILFSFHFCSPCLYIHLCDDDLRFIRDVQSLYLRDYVLGQVSRDFMGQTLPQGGCSVYYGY